MGLLRKTVLSSIAAIAYIGFAPAAEAQVNGDWRSGLGDIHLELGSSSAGTSGRVLKAAFNGAGTSRRGPVSTLTWFDGSYRNLVWEGDWYLPEGTAAPTGMPRFRCNEAYTPRGAYPAPTRVYGKFRFVFNAAENRFEGDYWQQCAQRPRGASAHVVATRNSMSVYRPAPAAPITTLDPNPNPGGSTPPGGGSTREERDNQYFPCTRMLDTSQLIVRNPTRTEHIAFTRNYQIRPCEIDVVRFEKFQLEVRNPEGKRPRRLTLKAIELDGIPRGQEDTDGLFLPVRFLPYTIYENLPFQGVPERGTVYRNLMLPGSFCNAALWVAYIDFTDGTQSEPFSLLGSSCGRRRNPLPSDTEKLSPRK